MKGMATKLVKEIRREIEIDGEAFTVAISPQGEILLRHHASFGDS